MRDLPNRRPNETFDAGPFKVTIGYWPGTNDPCEVFFTHRGKSGHDLDDILYEAGVTISKAMQNEN